MLFMYELLKWLGILAMLAAAGVFIIQEWKRIRAIAGNTVLFRSPLRAELEKEAKQIDLSRVGDIKSVVADIGLAFSKRLEATGAGHYIVSRLSAAKFRIRILNDAVFELLFQERDGGPWIPKEERWEAWFLENLTVLLNSSSSWGWFLFDKVKKYQQAARKVWTQAAKTFGANNQTEGTVVIDWEGEEVVFTDIARCTVDMEIDIPEVDESETTLLILGKGRRSGKVYFAVIPMSGQFSVYVGQQVDPHKIVLGELAGEPIYADDIN